MQKLPSKKGFSVLGIIGIIAIIFVIGGAVYYASVNEMSLNESIEEMKSNLPETMVKEEGVVENKQDLVMEGDEKMMGEVVVKEDGEMMENVGMDKLVFSGEVLAGNLSLLLDFNQADYQKALQSKKLVVLYFYANWCPICKLEFPKMQSAFNKINNDGVVGFRVNYNDNETDSFEKSLAREFGVAYQHTKVFVKNEERVLKSPESWNESKYTSEINNFLN